MLRWFVVFVGGFGVGVVAILAFEALGVYVFIKRLNQKIRQQEGEIESASSSSSDSSHRHLDPRQSLDYAYNKKGVVWVLESDKVPNNWLVEKVANEHKRKKEVFEVTPVRKFAKIKDRSFVLTDSDGSSTVIPLKDCTVEAVSASSLSSRKWAKRFPIKVESKTAVIYGGNKIVYVYLETSWEKESWCKALRLASFDDKERINWFTRLNEGFHSYLTSLNTGYPSFMKPSAGFSAETIDKASRLDGSASKVRLFWKKLARRASRTGIESNGTSTLGRDNRKLNEKTRSVQDPVLISSLVKASPTAKQPFSSEEENMALPFSSNISRSVSQSHISVASDIDPYDRFAVDEGTICWNLLMSRFFFDAKSNDGIKSCLQTRIQRTLSNMRIPTFIGEVICTNLDLGNLPPYINSIKVLPTDMNEVWAWEVQIEYSGSLLLNVETRLEVRDLDLQKGIVNTSSESSSLGDVSSDLLEGFEYYGKQLNLSKGTSDVQEPMNEGNPRLDGLTTSTTCTSTSPNVSRWKSILNSVAKQVSQVPLSLSIAVASLRGTLRFHVKPPPSDQLWFGFMSMPDIEFNLESFCGEHKITSGHIALFLTSRFKAAIRETMVLPNCESICIPWMLAEKDDWVPGRVAPFIWVNRDTASDHNTQLEDFSSNNHSESLHRKSDAECTQQPLSDSSDVLACSLSSVQPSLQSSTSLQDLRSPLLASSEQQETFQQSRGYVPQCPSQSSFPVQHDVEEDDSRPKKIGRRARMLDLGKKVGEKLEEKRRHIEEKGRNIVEKMRGP